MILKRIRTCILVGLWKNVFVPTRYLELCWLEICISNTSLRILRASLPHGLNDYPVQAIKPMEGRRNDVWCPKSRRALLPCTLRLRPAQNRRYNRTIRRAHSTSSHLLSQVLYELSMHIAAASIYNQYVYWYGLVVAYKHTRIRKQGRSLTWLVVVGRVVLPHP